MYRQRMVDIFADIHILFMDTDIQLSETIDTNIK